MNTNQTMLALVAISIVVPAVYTLFVVYLTRRGREFSKMDGLFTSMGKLHDALHEAFTAERKQKTARQP